MVPQTKVFVGSLPQGSKPEELRKLFERFGVVTECDIMNRCGFVHMQTEEQATAAIRGLNNTSFNGGVISVERGRIKERGQRGGGRGGRGGMRGGMDRRGGGPMRGAPGPGGRDAPYMRDARPMGHMRGPMGGGGMGARNGMPYERGPERPPPPAASYDDRYGGYGGEDRRGFALMDRGPRDPYAAPAPMYPDDSRYSNHISVVEGSRRGYSGGGMGGGMGGMGEELAYEDRRLYDEREVLERRRPPHAPPHAAYERARAPPGPAPDMYSRRSPMYAPQDNLRGPAGPAGYDRDPYAQQYPPMGRGGGAARGRELGPRRY